jgi:hypothetical protein
MPMHYYKILGKVRNNSECGLDAKSAALGGETKRQNMFWSRICSSRVP